MIQVKIQEHTSYKKKNCKFVKLDQLIECFERLNHDLLNFFSGQQLAERLQFQSKPTMYIRKTPKHIFQVLESSSCEICEAIVPSNFSKHLPEISHILLVLVE